MKATWIYLASRSPRRAELLQQIGVDFRTLEISIDEQTLQAEPPETYVMRLALEKARHGRDLSLHEPAPVLGSDTSVVLDGQIMGKPQNPQHAVTMLMSLAGKTHQVYTAVALLDHATELSCLSISQVEFHPLTLEQAWSYVQSGEPMGKAGSYAIQGLGAIFVKSLQGSFSGVMGLPLYETHDLLQKIGISVLIPPRSIKLETP